MNVHSRILIVATGIALAMQCAGQVTEREIRPALDKPIALIQTTALTWFDHQPCSSCHHQSLPMIVFDLARRRGVHLDQDTLERMISKTFDYLADLDRAVQGSHVGVVVHVGYRLVPAAPLGLPRSPSTGAYARMIARRQLPDGHWETDDMRPPQAYSQVAATAYALRTLELFLPEQMEAEMRSRVERARTWLQQASTRETEDRTFQLFGLGWSGGTPATLAVFRDKLLA